MTHHIYEWVLVLFGLNACLFAPACPAEDQRGWGGDEQRLMCDDLHKGLVVRGN